MGLHESGEMYLETIFVLSKEKGAVRAMDVAAHMNYSKPSVSRAVHLLEDNGYIDVSKEGLITLTDSGLSVAHKHSYKTWRIGIYRLRRCLQA